MSTETHPIGEYIQRITDECAALRAKNATLKRMIDLNANIEATFVDGTPEAMVAQICKLTHERDRLREALEKVIDYAGAARAPRLHAIAAEALAATQDPPVVAEEPAP